MAIGTENPESRANRVEVVQRYLESRLGIPVEITATTNYGGTIEAMRARKIDAASMGPFAYLIASEKAGAEAIASRGSIDGTAGEYGGTLAVAGDSPIRTIDEVVERSKTLTISFVDPASASGFLVERAYLDGRGIDPERDFKKVVFSNNHTASALTLLAKKVDIAAISENTITTLLKRGKLKPADIRVLWKSPRIPNSPVAVRKDLPQDLKRKLQDALVDMARQAPEAYRSVQTTQQSQTSATASYVRIDDHTFDELRRMARGVKSVQLLDSQ
jgi:phosphonate transport system substrate-binding protein